MNFIALTPALYQEGDGLHYVIAEEICHIHRNGGETKVLLKNGKSQLSVAETPDEIFALMKAAIGEDIMITDMNASDEEEFAFEDFNDLGNPEDMEEMP